MQLKNLREDGDIPQKKRAALLRVQQNAYSQYETGKRQISIEMPENLSIPTIKKLQNFAKPQKLNHFEQLSDRPSFSSRRRSR